MTTATATKRSAEADTTAEDTLLAALADLRAEGDKLLQIVSSASSFCRISGRAGGAGGRLTFKR